MDDATSLWHSRWDPPAALPQAITLDLGAARDVRTLAYQPRYDEVANGVITGYRISASEDGRTFTQVAEGAWPQDRTTKTATFAATRARHVRLEATAGGGGFASAAEIGVSEDAYRLPPRSAARAELAIHTPEVIGAGRTARVAVDFHNEGDGDARDVELELAGPEGWIVQPASATSFARVPAGASVTASFDVTAPAAEQSAKLTAVAAYDYGGRVTSGTDATVLVRRAPEGEPYVSDLVWISATNGFGPVERGTSNGERPAGDGRPLTSGGTTYAKGLGAHAYSKVSYYLGGACSRLTSVVDYGGDGGISDHADWAAARLGCA